MEATMRDYTGSIVFLGMDVHKLTYAVTAICDGVVIKRDTLPANPLGLIAYCKRFFPNAKIKSAYEAGFCGFTLHRKLIENDIENIVVHPASIEVMANDRIKNDKRDSLKIAGQLSVNRLKGIHIPTNEQEGRRSISRQRDCFAKEKTRASNRIKGFLYYHGLYNSIPRMSKKLIKALKVLELSTDLRFSLDHLISVWEIFNEKIESCSKRLEVQAASDELESLYRSVPGVGSTLARVLSNELGDMSQFVSEKDLFSYCGFTPVEYSSGESLRRGHMSRQGKSILRKGLTQAAWVAIRFDKSLEDVYERISQRAGGKRAIQGVARKLVGKIRACIRDKKKYEYKKIQSKELVLNEKSCCQDLVYVSCG
jgi:transposase